MGFLDPIPRSRLTFFQRPRGDSPSIGLDYLLVFFLFHPFVLIGSTSLFSGKFTTSSMRGFSGFSISSMFSSMSMFHISLCLLFSFFYTSLFLQISLSTFFISLFLHFSLPSYLPLYLYIFLLLSPPLTLVWCRTTLRTHPPP